MEISYTIAGVEALLSKIGTNGNALMGEPMREFFNRATLTLKAAAMAETPRDTGILQRSEATSVDPAAMPMWGKLGTNVPYGIYVHEGTRPHFPPYGEGTPLAAWGKRHGIPAFLVARAIARRGTKGRPFFKQGFEKSLGEIGNLVSWLARQVEERWHQ